MTTKEKIMQYLDTKRISKRDFYRQTGFSNGFLDSGKHIGSDNLKIIVDNYSDLNLQWLVTGEGEMILSSEKPNMQNMSPNERVTKRVTFSEETKSAKNVTLSDNHIGIPLIPVEAMAGFGAGSQQVMEYETQRYVVPEFTELKVDFMVRVKGSSMHPKYNSGDIVACKKLNLQDLFFQWNKVYVLDTEQGALIKRIKKTNGNDTILIVSDNESYESFELHLSKVNAIALVVGVIRLE